MLQVCLINDPRVGHDYYKLYTVQYLGNRIEGYPVRYINVPIDVLKKAAAETIKSKEVTTRWHDYNAEVYKDVCTNVCRLSGLAVMLVRVFTSRVFWTSTHELCLWID